MKPYVTALVVAPGDSEHLAVTLGALRDQHRKADRIVVIDTSADRTLSAELLLEGESLVATGAIKNLGQAIDACQPLAIAPEGQTDWFWLLHDDSAPRVDALSELLKVVEVSPSVAVIGPKQLHWNDHRQIMQLGLTLTKSGAIFSPIAGELDQAQHDELDDVLAVGTAGIFVRSEVYAAVGGFDPAAPNLAADVDFSIRVRRAGHRVVVAPKAQLAHAGLSLAGKRPKRWLGTSPRAALRRANAHLRIAYSPLILALAYILFSPIIGILRAVWAVAAKHPNRIWAEVSTGFWVFFTGFARLAARARVRRGASSSLSSIDALRASRQAVRQQRLHEQVREDAEIVGTAPLAPAGAAGTVGLASGSTISFQAAAPTSTGGTIRVTPASTILAAPGAAIALTATVRDQFGSTLLNAPITVTTTGRNNPAATSANTGATGSYTFTTADASTSTTNLVDTVTFTSGSATASSVTITYRDAAVGTVTATGGNTTDSVEALVKTVNGISVGSSTTGAEAGAITITATVKDALGNALAGVPVSFTVAGTGVAFTSTSATKYTGSTGTATGSLYAWVAGTYTYTITAGGKSTTGTATFGSIAAGNTRVVSATVSATGSATASVAGAAVSSTTAIGVVSVFSGVAAGAGAATGSSALASI